MSQRGPWQCERQANREDPHTAPRGVGAPRGDGC